MKNRLFVIVTILLSFGYVNVFSQTDWVLDNLSDTQINTSIIDSITYTKINNDFIQNLWYDGKIIESNKAKEGVSFSPTEILPNYKYCTYEDCGMEGILTENGRYAFVTATPDSTGYIYTFGKIGDDQNNCILYDSLGYIKSIVNDGEQYQVLYSNESLWIVDKSGNLKTEIPYADLVEENTNSHAHSLRRTMYLDNVPFYSWINNANSIFGYLGNWKQSLSLDLLHGLLRGEGNRYGDVAGYLIKAGLTGNLLDYLNAFNGEVDMFFFANASVTALDAIEEDICSYKIPCKVEGLYNNTCAVKFYSKYNEIMDIDLKLELSANKSSYPHNEPQFQDQKITGDGIYPFSFNFKELEELYDYEPSLTMDITLYGKDVLKTINNIFNPIYFFHLLSHPYSQYHRTCKIKGKGNSLVTGSVSSTVNKVDNVKTTTADVICSFSEVPSGANCVVFISRDGSDIGLTFNGAPGKTSQTIKATGLSVNTKYVASTYITYHGRVYDGVKSVTFTTSGPSGNVLSIDQSTITTTSAVAKCSFSGMDSGAECGIIAKSDGQTLTFKASPKDGEQDVPLTGLKPGKQYSCCAYVKMSNYYKEQDNAVSFTTKVPGITGTWSCKEEYDWRPFPGAEWQTAIRNYTITLHENGDLSVDGLNDYIAGSWMYTSSGFFNATAHIIATQTQNTWDRFEGYVDSVENPTTITGVRYRGNLNQVVNVEEVVGRITMTK